MREDISFIRSILDFWSRVFSTIFRQDRVPFNRGEHNDLMWCSKERRLSNITPRFLTLSSIYLTVSSIVIWNVSVRCLLTQKLCYWTSNTNSWKTFFYPRQGKTKNTRSKEVNTHTKKIISPIRDKPPKTMQWTPEEQIKQVNTFKKITQTVV